MKGSVSSDKENKPLTSSKILKLCPLRTHSPRSHCRHYILHRLPALTGHRPEAHAWLRAKEQLMIAQCSHSCQWVIPSSLEVEPSDAKSGLVTDQITLPSKEQSQHDPGQPGSTCPVLSVILSCFWIIYQFKGGKIKRTCSLQTGW